MNRIFQPSPSLAKRARELSLVMTSWPSVTGSEDEAQFPHKLASLLRKTPYFAANPNHLAVLPIPNDPLGRSNLIAWVAGSGTETVVLAGHFDTVTTDDYGDLKPLAGEAEPLREGIIRRLRESGTNPKALADLESGDFVPGRGLLDMKSGVAAGLAVLEDFASEQNRRGNLVLVTTPDEEDRSAGMRAAAEILPDWLKERGLKACLGINLDAICDEEDGATGRVVAFGCIGKLLLGALVVGKEAHAAYPLAGVNAAYLAAELTAELEFAPELGEDADGELATPPTVLGFRDLKSQYNVTVPGSVWAIWNVMLHRRKGGEVIEIAKMLARQAMNRAAVRIRERAERLSVPVALTPAWEGIPVLTYAEVMAQAHERDPAVGHRLSALGDELALRQDLDLPSRSRLLFEEAWTASGLEGPAVVLGFASMPYPAVTWPDAPQIEAAVREAMREIETATGSSIGEIRYFPGIADMSFLGPVDTDGLREAARQTPLWGNSIRWDLSKGATPAIPLVNIGPWGRDYHQWLERLHAPYAFEVLPELVRAVAKRVLALP